MYGLIGKKLGHSFSADFFNKKFAEEGIAESYRLFPIDSIQELMQLIKENKDLKGLNVTIPYKQDVIPLLNGISEEASKIGAVNVIKIKRFNNEIKLFGFNSDCIGFRDSLKPILRDDIKKALILGTGGASKAVNYVLENLGIEPIFVSRHPRINGLTYQEIDKKLLSDHLLIVNTTPLGMAPDIESCASIPYNLLTPKHICYDLVYNPAETKFMKNASQYGATVKNGFEMWKLQALASWNFWTE